MQSLVLLIESTPNLRVPRYAAINHQNPAILSVAIDIFIEWWKKYKPCFQPILYPIDLRR